MLHPAQKEIARSTKRFRVVCAGRRFGKSILAAYEMIGKALSQDNRRVAYFATTYQQARDIMWVELNRIAGDAIISKNESRLEITIRTQDGGSSVIQLRGWENVETLRGQYFDMLVLDEVASMKNFWNNWQEVLRPTLTDRKGSVLFIGTPKGFNWFHELYTKEDEDYQSFHFTSYDNPYIDSKEIDEAKRTMTEDQFAQEYMADFRKMEGLVYKEFQRGLHVFSGDPPQNVKERIAGVDFGYTNPTALLSIYRDYDDTYWVMSEWYRTGKTNTEIIEYAKSLELNAFYPDPAEPDRIEEMRRAGLNVREVSKDVKKGIDSVRELFKSRKLRIHENCKNLIWELENYHYKDKKQNQNEPEEPVKEDDHAVDALRYALYMNRPMRPQIDMATIALKRRNNTTNWAE